MKVRKVFSNSSLGRVLLLQTRPFPPSSAILGPRWSLVRLEIDVELGVKDVRVIYGGGGDGWGTPHVRGSIDDARILNIWHWRGWATWRSSRWSVERGGRGAQKIVVDNRKRNGIVSKIILQGLKTGIPSNRISFQRLKRAGRRLLVIEINKNTVKLTWWW